MTVDDDDFDRKTSILQINPTLKTPAISANANPCVTVLNGKIAGKVFRLHGEMTIGRAPGVDIVLDEEGVSRKHAKMVVHEDRSVWLTDLGSTNGTFYRGERVSGCQLRDGDKMQ